MSVSNVNGVRVTCDGIGCRETTVLQSDHPREVLPDGWYEIVGLPMMHDRLVFHQKPCLIGYITALSVRQKDGNGEVMSSVDDYMDQWAAVKAAAR